MHSKQPLALKRQREADQLPPVHPNPYNFYASSSRGSKTVPDRGSRGRSRLPYSISSIGEGEEANDDVSMRTATMGPGSQSASRSAASVNSRSRDATMRSYDSLSHASTPSHPTSGSTNRSRGARTSSSTSAAPSASSLNSRRASDGNNGHDGILSDGDEPMPMMRREHRSTAGNGRGKKRVSMSPRLQQIIEARLETLRGQKRRSPLSASASTVSSARRPPIRKKGKFKHVIVDFPLGKRKNPFASASARKKRLHRRDRENNDDDEGSPDLSDAEF